ncbi:UDPGP type 1 family protein [Candidatus Woesearchaeota archaeon]|nr:UDPGP type 1 family protein [Candidatus Woesearchaeota archaeon]
MTLAHRYQQAYEQANRYDQEHILKFWDELTNEQRANLLRQAESIDYAFIEEQFAKQARQRPDIDGIEPPVIVEKRKVSDHAKKKGLAALRKGKVAVFIVAGGQGSRLGFAGPKGCYPMTPLKRKPIFQILAEKVLAANKAYGTDLETYIMTSDTNHDTTVSFFEDNDYFGLDKDKVMFFKQHMYPIVDEQGKILLKNKHEIAMAPSGTGGIYRALHRGGILDRMRERNIDMLHYFHVDNPLVDVADPVLIGQHVFEEAEMSNKVVEKAYPEEPVGVLVQDGDKLRAVEYVFMLEELLYAKDEDGQLKYRAANIGNHVIARDFVERVAKHANFPLILAHKKVPYINLLGERITPLKPNAYKFESFVFDALPMAENPVVLSVPREEEFAPIKNAEGKDSPDSAHNLMNAQAKRWLQAAGVDKEVIDRLEAVEISPLFAHTEERFVQQAKPHVRLLDKRLRGQSKAYLQ